jgi:hypothetical protein
MSVLPNQCEHFQPPYIPEEEAARQQCLTDNEKKTRQNQELADRMCSLLSSDGRGARIKEVYGAADPIDCRLCVDGRVVFCEFTTYRATDGIDNGIRRSADLIRLAYIEPPEIPGISCSFSWKERQNPSTPQQRRIEFPRLEESGEFASQFKRMMGIALERSDRDSFGVHFLDVVNADRIDLAHQSRPDLVILARSEYPIVDRCCVDIRFRRNCVLPEFSAKNFWDRAYVLDAVSLRSIIEKKRNRVPRYRSAAAGKPVWLVIHALSEQISKRIPPGKIDDATETIKKLGQQEAGTDSFDAIWLMTHDQLHKCVG